MNLLELAEAGDTAGVLRELGEMTPDQRTAHAADLAARFEATDMKDWLKLTDEQRIAMLSARLGCQVTPEAAADCLLRAKFTTPGVEAWLVDVVNLYPAAWRVELVRQVDARAEFVSADTFTITDNIVRDTGCPAPTTDAYINTWLSAGKLGPNAEKLRNDVCTATLLPLVVERPGVYLPDVKALTSLADEGMIDRAALVRRVFADIASSAPWNRTYMLEKLALTPAEHARTASERVALVERAIARLLQDGTRKETESPLKFLRTLAPTLAENASFLRDHVAMLDLSLPVATYAQEVLIGLDEAGLLEPDVHTEACERVLLRPEKKLVRAQLSWLDRVIRRDSAHADRLLVDAAMTFQNPDAALQERALNLIARRIKNAGDAVLPELRTAAEWLGPGHSARAAEVLGLVQDPATEQFAEVLPAVPEPRPVPAPIATAAEVAQEVAAVLANDQDVVAFERALDGLVRHARLDRSALSQALKPVMRREPRNSIGCFQRDLYAVAGAVRGDEASAHPLYLSGRRCSPAGEMLRARLAEAIEVIESGTQPFLLAVPTLATGALDAAVLVERIAEFEALGVTAAPIDLAQALLRVTPTSDEQVLVSAEKLGSDAGRRLARWLRDGGLPHQETEPKRWVTADPTSANGGWWLPELPGLAPEPPLPPAAAHLIRPTEGYSLYSEPLVPFWLAQLPHHRDEVIADDFFGDPKRTWTRALPFVAESGGPAGFAVHMALAFGILCDMQEQRDEAVDALLVLAARGQLDSGLFGGQLVKLLRGPFEANRVHGSLRAAAETGAHATVWSILQATLPGLLRDTPVRGAGAFLELAVECAMRCGAKGRIAEVDAVAQRKGSTQTIKNARLLRDVLR